MLLEATIALLGLMGLSWTAAIWASYQEPKHKPGSSMEYTFPVRKAA